MAKEKNWHIFIIKNEWRLAIIARIISCDLVLYFFVGPIFKNSAVLFTYPK